MQAATSRIVSRCEPGNFSGVPGIKNQDYAAVEGMGPIVDRRKEHFGASWGRPLSAAPNSKR